MICRHYRVEGRVQGVGFRYFSQRSAQRLGLQGWVRNCSDGSVEALVQGEPWAVSSMEEQLRKGPSFSSVHNLDVRDMPLQRDIGTFEIRF